MVAPSPGTARLVAPGGLGGRGAGRRRRDRPRALPTDGPASRKASRGYERARARAVRAPGRGSALGLLVRAGATVRAFDGAVARRTSDTDDGRSTAAADVAGGRRGHAGGGALVRRLPDAGHSERR